MTLKIIHPNYYASLSVVISFALILLALIITVPVGAESVLPGNYHINIAMANGGERYLKFDSGGGLNAFHISGDPSQYYGSSIASDSQSGVFYITDSGGRGSDDDGILLLAVKGDVPDDFKVHIRTSGYTWTPSTVANQLPNETTYVDGTIDSTFTKSDFTYGPQNWRPAGPMNYPIYDGQDMGDASQQFHLMFIDTHTGVIGKNGVNSSAPPLTDYGAIKVEYSFEHMTTFAAFDAYAWVLNSTQGMGISWTNRLSDSGSSGFTVKGIEPTPTPLPTTTEPTTTVTTPNTTVSVTPTETPTIIETTLNVTPTVIVNQTTPATTITVTSTMAVPSTVMPLTTSTTTPTATPGTTVTVTSTVTATSSQPVNTATALPVTVGTTTGVTVSETTVQASLTAVPSAMGTTSSEPSVTVPALSTLFPSRIQTSAPAQAVTGASQVQSPTSGAGTVVPSASSAQATVTAQGVQTVASIATAVPATSSSQYSQTIATQSSSPSTGSTSSNSAGGPVSTGDSSSGSSSDDYTGVGGTVGTTATSIPTTATPTQTQSAAPTPSPTQMNTSTPVMTTPTLPLLDTGNQNEFSPVSISGSSGAASSRDRSSSQNFLSTIQSTIDRLSSSDLSLLLLIGAVLLFALLVFAGLIIMVLLLLLLVIGLLYLRQRTNLQKDLQIKD
ncbi:hypothetical protein [Methanosphaerula palustris]|uniref:Uncharacterized protein n=1 Tax=Methanosphaerula palustris (strain ATCC BAA-1556 / DSM 19958 / E1-9c) TaxID=521011 RepID=B8GK48_METPE|nr:hypothetical protein [Methanosphaerula palustris]ACL17119.1 hypothetical protein Mpal_1813 [Methanosphaerula palustris E1-9c]